MLSLRTYWLGLFKTTAQPGQSYWYSTRWYDGSISTYRDWKDGYPKYQYETCIGYTLGGWIDAPCDSEFYFISKKPAGSSVFHS